MQQSVQSNQQAVAQAIAAIVDIDHLMQATSRLSDLLTEESEHLAAMRVKEIVPLQPEKQELTKLLEQYRAYIAANPEFLAGSDVKKREELLLLTDDLAFCVEENYRRTAVARSVNQRVMQAIRDALTEKKSIGTYDRQGQTSNGTDLTLSMNLNQKA